MTVLGIPPAELTSAPPSPTPGRPQPRARLLLLGTWLTAGTPAHSPWRVLAAVGAIGEAVAHIPVTQQHLTEAPYIGVGFVLLTIAGFLLAQMLVIADTTAVWVSTLVVAELALAGFVLSRTIGLPQIGDDIGNWTEPLAIIAVVTEALMLGSAATHLLSLPANAWRRTRSARFGRWALLAGSAALLIACAASFAATGTPTGGMAGDSGTPGVRGGITELKGVELPL